MPDDLLRYRPQFPILDETTYLISNSLGAMPRAVFDAMRDYAGSWAHRGVRAWEEKWWMLAAEVSDDIGAIMNAPAGTVSVHQNVTFCQAIVASCFDFTGKRNKVVFSDLNFPSVMYFWNAQRQRGAHIEMVPTDGIHVPLDRMLAAIDEQTLLVPISHVIFRSAYINDARAIIERAHQVGALVVLDTFQSLGTVPVDVQALNADFACGGVLKWLCGGPGVGYLYVRPDLAAKLQPTLTGWIAHQQPFAFQIGEQRYAAGQYRFMNGTQNIPALYAAQPGLKIIREVGVDKIREKSKRQTAKLMALADERGWQVNTPRDPERRGGTVSIDMPFAQEVCAELIKRNILVDFRPNAGVRMSPHFYNKDEELEVAIRAVEEILSARGALGPMNYRAVLFDFDYTLADSTRGIEDCVNHALVEMGLATVSARAVSETVGLSLAETFCRLTGPATPEQCAEFSRHFIARADRVMVDFTALYDTTRTVIPDLKQRGLALGVLSTKFRRRIAAVLEREKMSGYFDVIVGGEDVANHKPHPEGALKAVQAFGAAAGEILYVGDSVVDAETARRAQLPFVAVLTGVTSRHAFASYRPVAVVESLAAVPGLVS